MSVLKGIGLSAMYKMHWASFQIPAIEDDKKLPILIYKILVYLLYTMNFFLYYCLNVNQIDLGCMWTISKCKQTVYFVSLRRLVAGTALLLHSLYIENNM